MNAIDTATNFGQLAVIIAAAWAIARHASAIEMNLQLLRVEIKTHNNLMEYFFSEHKIFQEPRQDPADPSRVQVQRKENPPTDTDD